MNVGWISIWMDRTWGIQVTAGGLMVARKGEREKLGMICGAAMDSTCEKRPLSGCWSRMRLPGGDRGWMGGTQAGRELALILMPLVPPRCILALASPICAWNTLPLSLLQ